MITYLPILVAQLARILKACGTRGIHGVLAVRDQTLPMILLVGLQPLGIYGSKATEITA